MKFSEISVDLNGIGILLKSFMGFTRIFSMGFNRICWDLMEDQ